MAFFVGQQDLPRSTLSEFCLWHMRSSERRAEIGLALEFAVRRVWLRAEIAVRWNPPRPILKYFLNGPWSGGRFLWSTPLDVTTFEK